MNSDITVLINSCDAYEDLWEPFFKLFHHYWPDCPYRVMLNTETKSFGYPGMKIDCLALYKNKLNTKRIPFGQCLIDHLQHITTKYVILLLDDFFLRASVDTKRVNECREWMESNPNIAVFSFEEVVDEQNFPSGRYPGFELRPPVGEYKLNLQAALWNTKTLIKYCRAHENPWEMEMHGNFRTFHARESFYSIQGREKRPFEYGFQVNGKWGVRRGKWVIDSVEGLFREHGIAVDYEFRGTITNSNSAVEMPLKIDRISLYRSIGLKWSILTIAHGVNRRVLNLFGLEEKRTLYQVLRCKNIHDPIIAERHDSDSEECI